MIYKSHVKASFVILFLILGVVGCNQEQKESSEPQSATESQSATDLSLPMKAGLYEIEITRTSSSKTDSTKRSKTRSKKRCYTEAFFNPFKSIHQNEKCEITNMNKSVDKVSFDISCDEVDGSQTTGSVEYSVVGDKLAWSKKLSSSDREVISTGVYVGDCE
jgi:hypothetical protein